MTFLEVHTDRYFEQREKARQVTLSPVPGIIEHGEVRSARERKHTDPVAKPIASVLLSNEIPKQVVFSTPKSFWTLRPVAVDRRVTALSDAIHNI